MERGRARAAASVSNQNLKQISLISRFTYQMKRESGTVLLYRRLIITETFSSE
jgi:hypothetical protein